MAERVMRRAAAKQTPCVIKNAGVPLQAARSPPRPMSLCGAPRHVLLRNSYARGAGGIRCGMVVIRAANKRRDVLRKQVARVVHALRENQAGVYAGGEKTRSRAMQVCWWS